MEKTGNKKARLVVESVKVKQEAGSSSSSAIVVAAAPDPSAMVAVEFDKHLLDCPLCSLPLKPPVFQCRARHTACGCCATTHSNKCPACTDGGGAYEHTDVLDPYLLGAKVRCPNEAHGCRSSVAYCLAGEHRLVCPHAPCRCPEPGCAFLGSPPALCRHLASHHAWPVTDIAYGSVLELHMQPAERQHLLLAENGERVFLVVASERGGGERVVKVKVVCVRASAEDGPWWYRCMVWIHAPVDPETGRKDVVMLEAKVVNCADPCEQAAMEAGGRCLHVSSSDVPPEGGILLRVRINKLQLRPPLPGAN